VASLDLLEYWSAGENVIAALVHAPPSSTRGTLPRTTASLPGNRA
jgi:hypothetical protein